MHLLANLVFKQVFITLRTVKHYGDLSSITLPASHVPLEARPLTKPAVNTAYFCFSTARVDLAAPVLRLCSLHGPISEVVNEREGDAALMNTDSTTDSSAPFTTTCWK